MSTDDLFHRNQHPRHGQAPTSGAHQLEGQVAQGVTGNGREADGDVRHAW